MLWAWRREFWTHQLCDVNKWLQFLNTTVASRRNSVVSLVKVLLRLLFSAILHWKAHLTVLQLRGETFPSLGFPGHIPYSTSVVTSPSAPQLSNLPAGLETSSCSYQPGACQQSILETKLGMGDNAGGKQSVSWGQNERALKLS